MVNRRGRPIDEDWREGDRLTDDEDDMPDPSPTDPDRYNDPIRIYNYTANIRSVDYLTKVSGTLRFSMPPRTYYTDHRESASRRTTIVGDQWECLDCGARQFDLDDATEHQKRQFDRHTLKQRASRWFDVAIRRRGVVTNE